MSKQGVSDITPRGHIADWEALALDYLEGTLAAPERARVDGHLVACPACRAALEDQRAVAAELHAAQPATPPRHLQAAVFAALGPAAGSEPTTEPSAGAEPTHRHAPPQHLSPAQWLRSLLQPRRLAVAATLLVFVIAGAVALSSQLGPAQRQAEDGAARTGPATTMAAAGASAESGTTDHTPSENGGAAGSTTSGGPGSTALAQRPGTTTAGEQAVTAAVTTTVGGPAVTTTTTMALDVMAKYMGTPTPTWVAVSGEQATAEETAAAFSSATGLEPLPSEYWMGGPTFAMVTATSQMAGLLTHLQKQGFKLGLDGRPLDTMGNALNGILAGYTTYPRLQWADEALAVDATSGALSEDQAALLVFFVAE